ncbi:MULTISPECIES: HAD family hydrolase [Cobetia]|uniref:HAD family phosphatase n=1 Tax=Cobetia crustatorum TaxID=553385 RepID=A0A558HLZ3_9GAMM|nr:MULTISPECIES: HAD family phosphatase [Cobetia]TVU70143.1 HAD family phosphatase [Cobetia crustatorum]
MKQLIFDCDGVLVDSEIIADSVLKEQLPIWLPDLGNDEQIEHELDRCLGMMTRDILVDMEGRSQHKLPVDALEQVRHEVDRRLAASLKALPGVREALEWIRDQRLPLAIVSNSSASRMKINLESSGLRDLLDEVAVAAGMQKGELPIFTSDDVINPKPAPDLYLLALKSLNRSAEECLVVEDSRTGMQAAVAAGLKVVGHLGASHIPDGHAQVLRDTGAWQVMNHWDAFADLCREAGYMAVGTKQAQSMNV